MEIKEAKKPRFCYGYSKTIDKYFIQDSRTKQTMKFTEKELKELIGCFADLLKGDEPCQEN